MFIIKTLKKLKQPLFFTQWKSIKNTEEYKKYITTDYGQFFP